MDKLQKQLIDAHGRVQNIRTILNNVREDINFKDCDKRIIENYAILNAILPIVISALEDILDSSGIIVTTDITSSGIPFVRYLEDAQFNLAQEDAPIMAEQRKERLAKYNYCKSDCTDKDKSSNQK